MDCLFCQIAQGTHKDTLHPHKVGAIVAGWDVPHTHIHIVPMQDYHDITSKSLLEGSGPTLATKSWQKSRSS